MPKEGERERSSIIVQTLAAQSRVGLSRTEQGALGLGCAIFNKIIHVSQILDLFNDVPEAVLSSCNVVIFCSDVQ